MAILPADDPEFHQRWRAQYEADMRSASELFADVVDEILKLDVPAEVTQTGGMSLAITWPAKGGHWLLTDYEGPLPWDREKINGWALGRYDDESEVVGEVSTTFDPMVEGAIDLAVGRMLIESDPP